MCWTAGASPAKMPSTTSDQEDAFGVSDGRGRNRADGEGEDGCAQGVSLLDTAGNSRSWTGRVRSVTGSDNKGETSGHFGKTVARSTQLTALAMSTKKNSYPVLVAGVPPARHWRMACATASHTLGVRTPVWARKACVRSCPWNERSCGDKAPRWRLDEGIHWVWRRGQEGSSAMPGSNLRRHSTLEHDGNHFSQEANEVIPGGGTEHLTQVMEPTPDDEGIKPKALRTTLTGQSVRSARAARDLLAAAMHEEHEPYRRNHR